MKSRSKQVGNFFTLTQMIQTALMAAVLLCVQVAFASLPNIELVSILLILFTVCFSFKQAMVASYVFAMLQGLIYGFGIWWITYLYVWQILIILTHVFKKNNSLIFWATFSGMFGLSFGFLCALLQFFILGLGGGITWWVAGIPFDISHCIGNVIVALIVFKPLSIFFNKLNSLSKHR